MLLSMRRRRVIARLDLRRAHRAQCRARIRRHQLIRPVRAPLFMWHCFFAERAQMTIDWRVSGRRRDTCNDAVDQFNQLPLPIESHLFPRETFQIAP